jgi:ubiquinone/menaquinone biosynthesis C-methylase UbiE
MYTKAHLLPAEALITTNSVDHADWNYKPLLRLIQRKRFQLVLSYLTADHYDKILEIGYGSGIFMPELSVRCSGLYGIDIHPYSAEVSEILAKNGIEANLSQGSVAQMNYPDESFDLVVSVSTFEFIDSKKAACEEIRRVLKKDGHFVIVTPCESWLLDMGFRLMTRESASHDFGDQRQAVLPVLKEHFSIAKSKMFPAVIGHVFPVYMCYDLMKK